MSNVRGRLTSTDSSRYHGWGTRGAEKLRIIKQIRVWLRTCCVATDKGPQPTSVGIAEEHFKSSTTDLKDGKRTPSMFVGAGAKSLRPFAGMAIDKDR